MRIPSNRMPPAPVTRTSRNAWVLLAALIGGMAYWVYWHPQVLGFIGAGGLLIWIQTRIDNRRRRHLADLRKNENICTFARTFKRGSIDTWVLRAVFESLAKHLLIDQRPIAVRQDDRWKDDLNIDPDDLDDLVCEAAFRAGRSLKSTKDNPLFGRVRTVADLITFLSLQPRTPELPVRNT